MSKKVLKCHKCRNRAYGTHLFVRSLPVKSVSWTPGLDTCTFVYSFFDNFNEKKIFFGIFQVFKFLFLLFLWIALKSVFVN